MCWYGDLVQLSDFITDLLAQSDVDVVNFLMNQTSEEVQQQFCWLCQVVGGMSHSDAATRWASLNARMQFIETVHMVGNLFAGEGRMDAMVGF